MGDMITHNPAQPGRFADLCIRWLKFICTAILILAGLLILIELLSSCSTTVYGPAGQPQFRTYANATNLTFSGPGTSLHADRLDHSSPTRAAGSVIGTATSGLGGIITAAGAGGFR